MSSFKETSHAGLGPLIGPHFTLITSLRAPPPNKVTFQGTGLQCTFAEDTIQSITAWWITFLLEKEKEYILILTQGAVLCATLNWFRIWRDVQSE